MFFLISIIIFLNSCDPEIFVANTNKRAAKTTFHTDLDEKNILAFDQIVIKPIEMNFDDPELTNQINKVAIKNVHNFTNLSVIFSIGNKDLQNLDSFTLDLRVFKNSKYDLEVRVFENKNKTLIFKKVIAGIKRSYIIIESERQLRKVFRTQLKKYKPISKVSSLK